MKAHPNEAAAGDGKEEVKKEGSAEAADEKNAESPLPWEKRREALLKAVDIEEAFAQFEKASRAIMERKEKEANDLAMEQLRLAREEEERRIEEERLKEEALEEERVRMLREEEEKENIDFAKILLAERKEEDALPKAAGAEDVSFDDPALNDVTKRLLALNNQRRRDD